MKKTLIAITLATLVCTTCDASRCKKCNGTGLMHKDFTCEYCEGAGSLPTERFGLAAGVTRWTERTYYTGIKTVENLHYKKFSNRGCPGCARSRNAKPGIYRRDITCEMCKGVGAIKPYTMSDIYIMKSSCDRMSKKCKSSIEYYKKRIKGKTEDSTDYHIFDSSISIAEMRMKDVGEVKAALTKAMVAKDINAITNNVSKLYEVSKNVDDVDLTLSQDKINEQFPYLYTAEIERKVNR